MMRVWRLSVWRLSVAYIGPKSRTERPRKTKIGTEVAHVTRDSDTTFKVKRSTCRERGHIVAASRTAFYHCALNIWQNQHKLLLILLVFIQPLIACTYFRALVISTAPPSSLNAEKSRMVWHSGAKLPRMSCKLAIKQLQYCTPPQCTMPCSLVCINSWSPRWNASHNPHASWRRHNYKLRTEINYRILQ